MSDRIRPFPADSAERFEDRGSNTSSSPDFAGILETRLSRRTMFKGGIGAATTAIFGGFGLAACGTDDGPSGPVPAASSGAPREVRLSFAPVAKNLTDVVTVPAGYTVTVLYRLGDPINTSTPAYRNDGTDSAASAAFRAGDHHDGMHYFGIGADGRYSATANDRALLVLNHEALTPSYLHPTGPTTVAGVRTVAEEVVKEMNLQGVSVIEIDRTGGTYATKLDSSMNRRITAASEMTLSGPAARSPLMITKYSPDGSKTRGTVNNCANGYTPWGTYLTCEENWAAYFRRVVAVDNPRRTAKEIVSFNRYGVAGTGRELWSTVTPDTADNLFGRWNAEKLGASTDGGDDYRNVANTFGYVVEIDPFAPASVPKKRTALGRFAHEGAWPGPIVAGKPLVYYMGCDSRNEYIYKFVSAQPWSPADANGGMAAGDKYLDSGKLYVARFDASGAGQWIELAFGANGITAANAAYPFADQADVLVNARLAADAAGATKMDRPEWGAVSPVTGEVYFTLTNTNAASRPITETDAANPRFYNDPKGATQAAQTGNPNGHIVRLAETDGDAVAASFRWDVYLFGARATASADVNLSGLSAGNDFSSPDGLWFSRAVPELLWIQTDDSAYTDVSNCMMLAALPGRVGDGATVTVNNASGTTTRAQRTFVGSAPGDTRLARFLVGPKECEITGLTESPDGRALFVNIQHPGEETVPVHANPASFGSHWPDGGAARPRSATIVVTRTDGGVVGASIG